MIKFNTTVEEIAFDSSFQKWILQVKNLQGANSEESMTVSPDQLVIAKALCGRPFIPPQAMDTFSGVLNIYSSDLK